MPYHVVMELALTGDPMPAERFHEFGLVNRLAEPGTAVDVALELAEQLSKSGPLALIGSKRILQEQFDWSSEEMWQKQGEITGPVMTSEDAKEGASAFKEKRLPSGKGAERELAVEALLALALAADLEEPLPQGPHQRCPGVLRGYCEIALSRSIAVVTMRLCSARCAAG